MTYKRYGKIRLQNHLSTCCFSLFYILFGIGGIIIGNVLVVGTVFISVSIVNIICILIPYRESFSVNETNFCIYKNNTSIEKNIPKKMIAVVSYADICTDLAKRVTLLNQTYMIKGEWAVSILEDVEINKVIKQIHGKGAKRYTNCWIEELLKQHFIYSFVCDQSLLEEVLSDKDYTLIIPETLSNDINTKKLKGAIYIDRGF